MSLHKFADMVASQGRGDDSLLIHMTPDEVQRLQQFAQANGRSLTINPDTGLPEAGILSDLFKAVAPIALGAFLGPGAFGIAGMGLSAGMAGAVTGGLTTLATGSLSRGLMAGLGAYGGAGLAEGLGTAGANAMTTAGTANYADTLASQGLTAGTAEYGEAASKIALDAQKQALAKPFAERMSAGLGAVSASPEAALGFAKQNMMPLAAAAAPIMAGQMVPTTTKMPENTNPAYIRQKLYDPYTQTYKSLAPVKAADWGSRSFSDAYTNPQTGEMATLQPRQTSGMAAGGIVALAGGGDAALAAYQAGNYAEANRLLGEAGMSAQDVVSKYGLSQADAATVAQNLGYKGDMGGITYAAPPAVAAAPTGIETLATTAAPTYNQYTDAQIGKYLTDNPTADIAAATKTTNADPAAVNRYITNLASGYTDPTATAGGSGTLGIYNQMKAQGIDPNELYAASSALNPTDPGWSAADITKAYNLDKGAYALSDQLKGKVSDKDWVKFMDDNNYSVLDAAKAFGLSTGEVQRRYDAVKNVGKVVTPISVVPGGTQLPDATTFDNGAFGNYGSGDKTGVDSTGKTVSVATPGDIITNPDDSRTVVPNIPGRPYGGFTGMDQVKSAYTAGGGSLGYIPKAPKTIAEFNQMYNRQTGDSMAAYDYLMGKAGSKYPIQSVAASTSTGIQRPYWSEAMRYKPKFLSYDKEGNTVSSTTNPKATGANAPASGTLKAKAINVLDNQGNTIEAVLGEDGYYHTSGGGKYDVAGAEVAAGGGMMGYAMGGGLGSLGGYSDGGRLLKGPGDGVSDSIPATIGAKQQPARLADGEFVIPARIVSELGNGSTDAGAKKLYAMMDRVQRARGKTTGKNKVAANSRADKHLPA